MDIIFSGSLIQCFLMGCCDLYQNTQNPKIVSIISEMKLDILELSQMFNVGIYLYKKYINSKFQSIADDEIINHMPKKFIHLEIGKGKYNLLGKLENGMYKTIFQYNEIDKKLTDLPNEILSKIVKESNNISTIVKVNKKLNEDYSYEYYKTKVFSYPSSNEDKIRNLIIEFSDKKSHDLTNLKKYINVEKLMIVNIENFNIKDYEGIKYMTKLKNIGVFVDDLFGMDIPYDSKLNFSNDLIKMISKFNIEEYTFLDYDSQPYYEYEDEDDIPIWKSNINPTYLPHLKTLRINQPISKFEFKKLDKLQVDSDMFLIIKELEVRHLILNLILDIESVIENFKNIKGLKILELPDVDFDYSELNRIKFDTLITKIQSWSVATTLVSNINIGEFYIESENDKKFIYDNFQCKKYIIKSIDEYETDFCYQKD
jgi:hypothetical protein